MEKGPMEMKGSVNRPPNAPASETVFLKKIGWPREPMAAAMGYYF
jgi:hypothetical protein